MKKNDIPDRDMKNNIQEDMSLIPAGTFEMGDSCQEGSHDEYPIHTVELDAFYMDTHLVSIKKYRKFVQQTGSQPIPDWIGKFAPTDNHPIIGITWHDANNYAKWAGKRLPTEAEWEYAARGGLEKKRYPWGNEIDRTLANFENPSGDSKWDNTRQQRLILWIRKRSRLSKEESWDKTSPVGYFAPNAYGLYDMSGNVWEWCADWYKPDFYQNSPQKNPQGPLNGKYRVLRGGSWHDDWYNLRVSARASDQPESTSYLRQRQGFRCAMDIP